MFALELNNIRKRIEDNFVKRKFNLLSSLVMIKPSSNLTNRRVRVNATGYALENISFNVQFWCRHVPSIDRGRRLACVYRPIRRLLKE